METENWQLFLKQAAGNKGSDRREQPLDPPQLDGLPVENGPGAEKHANRQSSHHTEYAQQKSDDGWGGESEPLAECGEFSETRDFQRAGSVQVRTANATRVTVE